VKVLLTGASGMIGREVCGLLAQHGHDSVVTHRRELPTEVAAVSRGIRIEDIATVEWDPIVAGVDAVVHLAAHVHVPSGAASDRESEFERVNRLATARLVDACVKASVKRFVLMSSVSVYGDRERLGITESTPPEPVTFYGRSKLNAERATIDGAGERLSYVILRPPMVYGPHAKAKFLQLMRLVKSGVPLPLGSVRNLRSFISVQNLADVTLRCLEDVRPLQHTFLVSDGDDVSTPELIRRLARVLRTSARLVPFPVSVLQKGARLAGLGGAVRGLLESLTVESSAVRQALSWNPPMKMENALEEAAYWYRQR
jgi:nucleoside-diphosphate-sugar epimerase